jgi:serine/threonine protein kinase
MPHDPRSACTPASAPQLAGQTIRSRKSGNSYTIGELLGEGRFGWVYSCKDLWENELAAKVFKPREAAQLVANQAVAEFQTLLSVRPHLLPTFTT